MLRPPEAEAIPVPVQPSEIPDRPPRSELDCSGSAGTMNRAVRRPIRDEGRASKGVAKRGETGKVPRPTTVG